MSIEVSLRCSRERGKSHTPAEVSQMWNQIQPGCPLTLSKKQLCVR